MRTPEAAASILVLLAISQVNLSQTYCVLPQPGKCSSDTYTIHSNDVHPLTAGSCDFTQASGLCCYQQGCRDPVMSNWTLVVPSNGQGSAQAHQNTSGSCGSDYYYSVLESPWLNVTQESCLKFTYSRSVPAALDVFLEQRGGQIMTVLSRSHNSGENQRTEVQEAVGPGTGKIIFRVYGGGSIADVRVYKVSVETGSCIWPVNNDVTQGTSPLLSPTEPGTVDCLYFTYNLSNTAGSMLTVSVQPLGDINTVTVWRTDLPTLDSVPGQCPLQVRAPYRIIFKVVKPGSATPISVTVTQFTRSVRAEQCPLTPTTANTSASHTVVTSSVSSQPAEGQCPSGQPSTTPSASSSSSSSSSLSSSSSSASPQGKNEVTSQAPGHFSTSQKFSGNDNTEATVIGLAVALAVALAALVVAAVAFVWWRRRINHQRQNHFSKHSVMSAPVANPPLTTRDIADDVTTPSVYTSPGQLSPPNPYSSLQLTKHDVIDATTSSAPCSNISMTEAASYYNVGRTGLSAASSYQNSGHPIRPDAAADYEGHNVYEEQRDLFPDYEGHNVYEEQMGSVH